MKKSPNTKIEIATFGSATRDIFIKADSKVTEEDLFPMGRGVCFPLGSKVKIDEVSFSVGGGGTNTAATFSTQGFKTAYVGKVGNDAAGREVVNVLKEFNIATDYLTVTDNEKTNTSIVLDVENEDRTILVYRGASGSLKPEEVPEVDADWFYIAPFSIKAEKTVLRIVEKANKKGVKVAMNPSADQLKSDNFNSLLSKIDLLFVNKEEAATLTGIDYKKEKEIFEEIDDLFRGIFVMTKGPEGVSVSDDQKIYEAGIMDSPVADRTGAGDSFASGFLSGLIREDDVTFAVQLGVANSAGCLSKKGAKRGLLKRDDQFLKVKVNEFKKRDR